MNTYLNQLPDINFAQKDTAIIEEEVISYFENALNTKLFDGNQRRIFLLAFIKYLALQRNLIDFSGKQNLLRYAGEGFIQHIAALVGVEILEASAAVTTLRFTLSTSLSSNLIIRQGTRVTPGNKIYFATVENAEITSGSLSVDVAAICTEKGGVGNGYYPGQVNQLSDPFPYNCTVENITLTQGGANREELDAFRERTRIAPESFSSAGPTGAYVFWAKSASQLIIDVAVNSPSPGTVEIVPLLKDGEIPTQSLLDKVYEECNAKTRRPLTDQVIVRMPETILYPIFLKYYVSRNQSTLALSLQHKVLEVIENFILWQKSVLGRDLNPSKLVEMLMTTGIKRVEITEPSYQIIKYYQIAIADIERIQIIYGGVEDD